jgi:hypothetical protein
VPEFTVAEDNNAKSADEMLLNFVKGREMAQVLVKPIEATRDELRSANGERRRSGR